jgi:hypothetical protein
VAFSAGGDVDVSPPDLAQRPQYHKDRIPMHGYEATREASMAAFAKRLAAGVVLRSGSPLSGANRTTFSHFETYRF